MRNVFPARGPLTDDLLAHLRARLAGIALVGDGVKPDDAGWRGQPNDSDFVAYVVLGTGDATPRAAPSVGQAQDSWTCGYTIDFYGVARAQADDLADAVRLAALAYGGRRVQLGQRSWSVGAVRYGRLGGIRPNHSQDPPLWGGQDVAGVWIDADRG